MLRWFHAPADYLLVTRHTVREEHTAHDFKNISPWSQGVDAEMFKPGDACLYNALARPIWLYVGRIAVEKNLDAFL